MMHPLLGLVYIPRVRFPYLPPTRTERQPLIYSPSNTRRLFFYSEQGLLHWRELVRYPGTFQRILTSSSWLPFCVPRRSQLTPLVPLIVLIQYRHVTRSYSSLIAASVSPSLERSNVCGPVPMWQLLGRLLCVQHCTNTRRRYGGF